MRVDVCVVCGLPSVGYTGYLFLESGKIHIGMPFCRSHIHVIGVTIANPVFENEKALTVFKQQHPDKYVKYVKGKQIIFLKNLKEAWNE